MSYGFISTAHKITMLGDMNCTDSVCINVARMWFVFLVLLDRVTFSDMQLVFLVCRLITCSVIIEKVINSS